MPNAAVWILLLWLAAALAYSGRVGREWGISRRLAATGLPITDETLLERYALMGLRFGLSRLPRLLLSEEVDSPVLIGALRPALVLPPGILASCTNEELDAILAHELAHLKRRDLLWAWVPTLAQALFFFHPLVWLTRQEWRLAQEIACDELALRVTRVPALQYGQVVLKVAAQRPSPRLREPAAVGAVGSYRTLRRRLLAIQQYRPVTHRQARRLGMILVVTGVAVLVPWRLTEQSAPSEPQRPSEEPSGMGSLLPREAGFEPAPQAGRRAGDGATRDRSRGTEGPERRGGDGGTEPRREGTDGARPQPERPRPSERVHPLLKREAPPARGFRRQRRYRFARHLRERSRGAGFRAKQRGSESDNLEVAVVTHVSGTPTIVPGETMDLPVEPDGAGTERNNRLAATAGRRGSGAPHVYLAASGGDGRVGARERGGDGATGRRGGKVDLRKVNLSGAELTGQDLSSLALAGATLSGAHMEGAHLSGMNLSGANFSNAHLKGARMARADLTGADLSGADLSRADLSQARVEKGNLSGANLRGARLARANLIEANLSGADLTGAEVAGARLDRAILSGADLTGVDLSRVRLDGAILSGVRGARTRRSTPEPMRYLTVRAGPAVRQRRARSRSGGQSPKNAADCPAPSPSPGTSTPTTSSRPIRPAPFPTMVLDGLSPEQAQIYLDQVLRQMEKSLWRAANSQREAQPVRHERDKQDDQQEQEKHSDCPPDLDTH
jgi:beta-lactamase regulating signal transducer with metallopeptidase domain